MEQRRSSRLEDEKQALTSLIEKLQDTIGEMDQNFSEEKDILQNEVSFLKMTLNQKEFRLNSELDIVLKERDALVIKF